jgi:hypothetical protein
MYDARKVEEMFLRGLKLAPADLLQPQPGQDDVDPVSENVAAAMGRPVYVLPRQDHMAHLRTHLAFLKSPLFGSNPAIVKTYLFPMAQHVRDHLLNYYLTESHDAVKRATEDELIRDDADQQAEVILRVQQLIEQQLGAFAQELAQLDQAAQQFKPQPPMPPDNSMQVAQLNAQLQGQLAQQRAQLDQARLAQQAQSDQARLAQQAQTEQARLQDKQQDRAAELQREALRQQAGDARQQQSDAVRYQMNTDDNETALRLAAAEIASGEKVAVSTGTGINPNP